MLLSENPVHLIARGIASSSSSENAAPGQPDKKVLGVPSEGAENVVLVLPKASAQRLVASDNQGVRDAALFEGEAFLNAVPISLWHQEEEPAQETAKAPRTPRVAAAAPPTEFFEDATRRLNIYREVGKQLIAVKYGSDAEIAAVWSKFEGMNPGYHPRQLRSGLLLLSAEVPVPALLAGTSVRPKAEYGGNQGAVMS